MKLIFIIITLLLIAIGLTSAETYAIYFLDPHHDLLSLIGFPGGSLCIMLYGIYDTWQLAKGPTLSHSPQKEEAFIALMNMWHNDQPDEHALTYQLENPWRRYIDSLLAFKVKFPVIGRRYRLMRWLTQRARKHPQYYTPLATRCYLTLGNSTQFERAYAQLAKSATGLEHDKFGLLGYIYICPESPYYDQGKAIEYFQRGHAKQDNFATLNLAFCYELGIGVKSDLDQATQLYRALGERTGQIFATLRLSMIYQQDEKLEEAYYWAYIAMIESERLPLTQRHCEQLVAQLWPEQVVQLEEYAQPLLRLLALKQTKQRHELRGLATGLMHLE